MIYYGCPKCQAAMASPDGMAGGSETCPQCGNVAVVPQPKGPVPPPRVSRTGPSQYDPEHTGTVVAVEMTSKKLKFHHALSCLAMVVTYLGTYAVFAWDDFNNQWKWLLAAFLATCWFLWIRVLTWWHHG